MSASTALISGDQAQVLAYVDEAAEQLGEEATGRADRVERWEQAVATKLLDVAPNTRRAYRHELTRWSRFLDLAGVHPVDASVAHARAYRRWLSEAAGLATSSVARAISALSGICQDVLDLDPSLLTANPFDNVRRPKVERTAATPSLDVDEARTFLAASKIVSPRAQALALLLLGTGLRISEALGATFGDLHPHNGSGLVLTVQRKGGRTARVAIPEEIADALHAYLKNRGSRSTSLVTAARAPRTRGLPLFAGRDGPLSASEARRDIERICRACNWPAGRVTAHGLRHTYATTAVEACDLPVRHVQHALGHASVGTTETYLHDDRFAATVSSAVVAELLG